MYTECSLCPRACHINRKKQVGACHTKVHLLVARAALHMWEEPCISGENGSGAVFFSGCSLGCVFCQNGEISSGKAGKEISVDRLVEIFFELKMQGANNINLVTGDHFVPDICQAVIRARNSGLGLPFVYNCSGYESVEMLRQMEGLIDVYLPDFKYWNEETAVRYSKAKDYPIRAREAVAEMVRQVGTCRFNEDGMIEKGVIVRHLLLPGKVKEAKAIVNYLYKTYGNTVYLSLMNQYTPLKQTKEFPELCRKVTTREYERLLQYAMDIGVEHAFIQEGDTAKESFIPAFDLEGV